MNYQSQSQMVEYKVCPSNHHLSLCDSSHRNHPTCNMCGNSNLNNSWTCFSCNYDMCLSCYDSNNSRPTNSVKVCNNRHTLHYTDSYKRPNVTCNKCGSSNLNNQYTCYACNYDECMSCYEGRSKNSCNIF